MGVDRSLSGVWIRSERVSTADIAIVRSVRRTDVHDIGVNRPKQLTTGLGCPRLRLSISARVPLYDRIDHDALRTGRE